MKNIYWKDIQTTDQVVDCGTYWKVGDAVVFWHGTEASEAQRFLARRSK